MYNVSELAVSEHLWPLQLIKRQLAPGLASGSLAHVADS